MRKKTAYREVAIDPFSIYHVVCYGREGEMANGTNSI